MSTFEVKVHEVIVEPHPNADALELAVIGGFKSIIGKNQFKTGDKAIYIPEAAVLPEDLIEKLGLTGRLAGPQKNRVKAVRLRGELSQGIVAPLDILVGKQVPEPGLNGCDYAESLGIVKFVPEIPTHMNGAVKPATNQIRWIDIENIKREDPFDKDEWVEVTEKIHGTCVIYSYDGNELTVSSKGYNAKGLALVEDDNNLYWKIAKQHNIKKHLERLFAGFKYDFNEHINKISLFGEIYGNSVQDLKYGAEQPQFAAFDFAIQLDGELHWFDYLELSISFPELPLVPLVSKIKYNRNMCILESVGKEQVSGKELHIREGVVVRSTQYGKRKIAKFINPDYLTRKNGSEYE